MVLQRPLRLKLIPAEHLLNSNLSHIYSQVVSHSLKFYCMRREASAHLYLAQERFLINIIVANPVWTSAGENQQVELFFCNRYRKMPTGRRVNYLFLKDTDNRCGQITQPDSQGQIRKQIKNLVCKHKVPSTFHSCIT